MRVLELMLLGYIAVMSTVAMYWAQKAGRASNWFYGDDNDSKL